MLDIGLDGEEMSDEDRFEAFRELLEGKSPSLALWRELCERVEVFGDDAALEEELGPKINELIEDWDVCLRSAPATWIDRLLEGEHVSALVITRKLDLRCQHLMFEDAELLAESPELLWISHLNFAYNGLQDEGLTALVKSAYLSNVEWLDLSGNSIEAPGINALAKSPHLKNLKHLDLTGNWVNDAAATYLANSESLQHLETLVLRGNPIKTAGAEALANSPFLSAPIRHFWDEN